MDRPPKLASDAMTVKVSGVTDELHVRSVHGHEALGCLFEYQVELVNGDEPDSVRDVLDPEERTRPQDLLGQTLTMTLPLANQKARTLSGIITRAQYRESYDLHTTYRVTINPELWRLTLNRNCRIFQDTTVPAVVEKILGEHQVGPIRSALLGEYRRWDFLTQHRESDFAFISRLLAQEGIYYYFEHNESGHTLVLIDSVNAHHEHEDFKTVPIGRPKPVSGSDDCLMTWLPHCELQTEAVTLADFDFRLKRMALQMSGHRELDVKPGRRLLEIYDHPAACVLAENQEEALGEAEAGESRREAGRLAQIRLEERRCQVERYHGQGTVRWLATGLLFSVAGMEAKQKFLVTGTTITWRNSALRSGGEPVEEPCEITVTAIDSRVPFRSPLQDKPRVWGPQTAWVVGGGDEEIWTDKYGRIRVQFHWDREGQSNQDSSCWLRVAQPWAGNRWGAIAIPRVGNEVVVEFLQGDPDRPLVTGSLYSGENLPPYNLPKHKTQSGIKTRSSKGGTAANFNEIRFEDKKGEEELHIQAERNMSTLVKHDQMLGVHGNRAVSVKGDERVTVDGTRNCTITQEETQTFQSNRTMTVSGSNADEIFGSHTGKYHGGRTEIVEHGYALNVVASGGGQTCTEDSKDGAVAIVADKEIRLECGQASLILKKDGTVAIKGSKSVSADGAGAMLGLAESGASLTGKNATVSGEEMAEFTGRTVKLN